MLRNSSAFESLVVSLIGDLFFVHQRGYFMTLIQFILGAASNFSAIVVGPIAANLGWRYLFHILIAFAAVETVLLILFVPETSYNRDRRYEIDELVDYKLEDLAATEKRHAQYSDSKSTNDGVVKVDTSASAPPVYGPKKTFVQELAVFTGVYSDDNLLQLFIAPFAVCLNLAVLWVVVVTGGLTAFFVAQSYVSKSSYSNPRTIRTFTYSSI